MSAPCSQDRGPQVALVLRVDRVGGMVRERAVELREEVMQRDREPLQHRRRDEAAHPVRGVGDHGERPHGRRVEERQDVLDVGGEQIALLDRAGLAGRRELPSRPSRGSRGGRVSSPTGRAPDRQNFNPLYCFGLWLAVIITAGRSSDPDAKYRRSVDASPRSTTSTPREVTPSESAAASSGDESRQSRPMTIAGAPENSANAAPMRRAMPR